MSGAPGYTELAAVLQRSGCLQTPSEVHGALCGALCVFDPESIDVNGLLDPNSDQDVRLDSDAAKAIGSLCQQSVEALEDESGGFEPLLPDDEQNLSRRVLALSSWCEGFLFGLATKQGLDLDACTDALREILTDLTEFTRASLQGDEDDNLEEEAYVELVEYVRVGVQVVYIELRTLAATPSDGATLH